MRTLRRTIKLLFFGLVLLVLSVAYRFLGERKTDPEKRTFLDPEEANADVPQACGGGGCGDPGCPSVGGCDSCAGCGGSGGGK